MTAETKTASIPRRHDLDALRAVAMLLGIVLHGAMSFIPAIGDFWGVHDCRANELFGVLLAAIHGFRMPLFFLISGFFTAMLWQKRGTKQLLLHRFKRIFLPMMISLLTIIPATWAVTEYVSSPERASAEPEANDENPLASKTQRGGASGIIAAVATGDTESLAVRIDRGEDLNAKDQNGSTPLHVACFFGRADAAKLLLEAGADTELLNNEDRRAVELLSVPWGMTSFIAGLVKVDVNQEEVFRGRREIAELMGVPADGLVADGAGEKQAVGESVALLMYFPLFGHLWFLWFLCWLVVAFVICASIGRMLGLSGLPEQLVVSPWRYVWLIPLTAVPLSLMSPVSFGPDTSIGLIPIPSVLAFYAIFFAFGVLYFNANDLTGEAGKRWWLTLPLGLFIVFPVGLMTFMQTEGVGLAVSSLTQAAYAWLFTFGMMGLFRRAMPHESRVMRYVSDSSYWLYLAHIPLIIYLQFLVRDWQASAWLKFPAVCIATSGLLLGSYQLFVRYTPIGTLLNGRRGRPVQSTQPVSDATLGAELLPTAMDESSRA